MKKTQFIIKTIVLFLFQSLVTVVGWIIIPVFLKRVEEFDCTNGYRTYRFKDKWFDDIFGNSEDGIDYDVYSLEKLGGIDKINLWTRYKWCAHRNPIHNLALHMGVNEEIVGYSWHGNRYTEDRVGHEGFVYSEAIGVSGKVYPMIRWCKLSKVAEYISNTLRLIWYVCVYVYRFLRIGDFEKFGFTYVHNVGVEMNIGYKNFNVQEVPAKYSYSFTVSFNPLKRFEP